MTVPFRTATIRPTLPRGKIWPGKIRRGKIRPPGVAAAMLRRDLAGGRLFGLPILLDIGYGAVNLLVFLFISRVLHHPGQQGLGQSPDYFDFVAVGLAFMLVAQVACAQLTSRVLEERRNGTLEVLAQAPVSRAAVALGMAAYPMVVGLLRASIYLTIACALLGVGSPHPGLGADGLGADGLGANWMGPDWFGAVVILLLGGLATTGLALAIGAFAVTFPHGLAVSRALIVALGFLSGAYFPTGGLPAAVRPMSAVLPTRMAIDGLRAAINGGSWLPFALLLAATAAVLVPVSTALFVAAIGRSIRKGALNHG